ncbi:hypothetical protein BMF94_2167 [Rhodotorula taiwanensis]|uniref:SET domain-containing protein n=1 Tax=Rhodotorula taiwanensis TaxID=741276 RepID=A0A2S5BD47_9BASI|nr:hypothetical protein BMF94_2167 [Rhodotorula taiwanensis]
MLSDWAELKSKRRAKETSAQRTAADPSTETASPTTVDDVVPLAESPSPDTPSLPLWEPADLPGTISIEQLAGRGRGLFARTPIKGGTTLLATKPLVSVLDSRNLPHRCSHCFRSVDELEVKVVQAKPKLLQCSLCHTLQYCSPSCQKVDWAVHKKECVAIRSAIKQSKAHGAVRLPDAPLRALGRLLWTAQANAEVWRQVETLESHRAQLTAEEQEKFFQLSVSLSAYVGQETLVPSCPNAASVIDLCSRFVSNSFALTCPTDLSNIGVSISPLTAMINHSCAPNAVVVYPSFPDSTSSDRRYMAVVALRDLVAGEEILTSYVDLSSTKAARQKELEERYKFRCACEGCVGRPGDEIDPREALACPATGRTGCRGLIQIPGPEAVPHDVRCPECGSAAPYRDVHPAIDAAKKAYVDADKTQYSDPRLSLLHLGNLISGLTTSLAPSPPIAPSASPLYPALQLLLTLQLHAHQFDEALPTATLALEGARRLFPAGHPVLALLMTTHARLVTTPPASDPARPEPEMQYWMATDRRVQDIKILVAALREVEKAFGDGSKGEARKAVFKGGEMAALLRVLIRDQEEGIEMGRRMKASMAAQQ